MSEIREELEHFARLAEAKAAEEEATQKNETLENINNDAADNSGEDQYLSAPENYTEEFAKTFGELPLAWRRYLTAREQEIAKGFSNLQNKTGAYKWLDKLYSARVDELQKHGVKSAEDWVNNMVRMDSMLSSSPADAIKLLADTYQVNIAPASVRADIRAPRQTAADALSQELVCQEVKGFAQAADDNGNQKHPFFGEVIKEMSDLLSKGVVNTLEDAYDAAVWFNTKTRDKLIAKRSQEALELKSKDAKKAKEAAFAPKGRAEPLKRDLTLREELEMRFAALEDED